VAVVAVAIIVSGIIRTVAVGSEELGSPDRQAPWIANPPEVRISSMGQSYNTRRDFREAMVRSRNMEPKQAPSFGIAGADVTWFFGPVEKTAKNKPRSG
jgi:hypothetical protein